MSAAIVLDGRMLWEAGFGNQDVEAELLGSSAMIAARCAHSTEWASTFWP